MRIFLLSVLLAVMYVAKGSSSSSSSIAAEKLGKPETCAGDFGERCNASRPTPKPYKDLKKLDWYRAAGLDPANKKLMAQFESDLNRKSRKRRDASDIGTQMNSYFEALRLLNQSSGESEDYNSEPQTADTPEWLLWGLNYPEPTAEMIIDTSSVAISTSELTSVAEEAPFDEEVSEIISSTTVEEETEGPMYTTVGKGAMETEINTVEIISKEESPSSSETNIFEATSAEIATTDGNQSAMIFQSSTNLINSMNEGTLKITVETITQDPLMMRTGSTGISLNTEIETSSTKISSSLSTIEGAEEASINDVQSSKYETEGYTAVETTSNEEFLETTKEQFKSTEKLEEITSVLTSRIEKEENEETESLLVTTEAEFTETSLTTEMETLKTKISSTFSTIEDTEETLITVTPLPKEKTKVYASVETTTNEEFIRRTQGQFKSTEKLEEVTSVLTSRIEKEEETKVTTEIPPTSESPLTVRTESTRISLNTKVEMPTTKISSSLSTIGITEKTSITDIQSPQQETEAYTTIEKTINEEFTKTNEPLKSTEKFEEVTSEFTSRMEEESDITTETPATTENPVTTAAESSIISLITEVETSTTKISSSLSTIGETETYTTVKTIESEESTKTNEPLRITEKLEEITTMFTGKTEEEIEITTEIPATTESPTTARTESSVVSLITEVQTSTTKISSSLSTVESTDETSAQEREGYTTLETTGNEEIIRTKEQVKSTEELEEVTSVLTSRMEEESEITTEISATTEGLLTTRLESTPISISTEVKTPTAKISLSLSTVESTEETETYTAVKTIGNEEIIKTTKEEFKSTEKLEQVTSVLTSRMEEESEITTEIPAATEGLLTTKSEPTPMSFSIEVETPTTKISSSLSTVESTEETSITISQLPKEETETYTAVETTSNEEIIRTTKERLKSTEKLEQVTSVLTSRMEEESEITTEIPAATEGQLTTKAESSPMSFSIEVETPTTKISSSLSTVENIQETSITISQLSKEETESYSSVEITMSEESVRSTKKPFKSTEKLEEVSSVLTSRMEKEENEITTEILPTSVSLITSETESTEKSLSTELEISTTKIFSSVSTIEGTGETLITDMQSSKQETEASTTTETTTTEEFVRTSKEPLKSTEKFEEITSVLTSKMEEEESKMTIEIPPTSESPLTVRTESTRISFNTKVEMPTTKISSSPSTIGNTEKTSIINIQSPQQETEAYTTIEKTINEEFTKTNEPLRSTEKFEKVTSAFTGRMEEESDITTETAVTTESPVTTTTEFSIISSISEMETSTTKISSSLSTILDTEETTITDTQTSQQETESYTTVEKTINEKLIKTNEPLRSTEKLEKVTVVFTSRMEEESEITTEIPATTGTESALVSLITEVETSMTKISSSLSTVESTEKTSITDVQSSKEETETFSSIEIATSEESLRSTKELIKSTEELEGVTSVLTSKMEKEESGGSTEKLYSTAYDTSTEKFFQTLEISSIPIENILEKSTTEDLDKKLTKTISLSTSTETERISESTSMEFTESITKSLIFTTVPMTVEESTFTPVTNIISLETLSTNAASLSRSAATVSPEESTLEWSTITTDEVETKETTSSEMKTKGTIYTIGEKTEPITQKNVEYDEEHEYDYTTIEIIRTTGTPIPLESTPFLDEMETEDEESERKSILVLKTNLPISIATKARHFFGLEKTTEKIEIKKLTPWQIVDTSTTDISEISSTTEIVDEISTTSKAKEKSTESTTETAEETTIMKSTAETTEETAIRSTTEAIEETTVRSTTETEEDTTVGGTTETEEETTVGSTTETEKETTMKSTTEIAKETTIKSTTETEKETTIKSTTENAKETTIKSTTENAEETTIKSTTEAVEETTIKSTTEAIEETTLRSTTETEEDTTVGGTTETEEETTVESTTETEKETTMKSTTEIAKETTIKSTTKIAEETTMKSTAEAIEETTVRSTTEIEEETTVRSTTETEEETTVKSTTEIAEETTVASTSETEKETTIKSTSGTIVETVTVSKVEETTTKSTTIKKITTETPSIKSIHLTERLTTIEAGTDDYKDFSREDTSLVVETTRKHKEEKYLTTKSSEIEKTLEDEEEYPEEEDTTDTFEYYYEAESTTKGPKWESFPSYSTTVLPRLDYDDVVNPDVLEITKPPTKLLLEVTMPSISTSVESFSDFSSPDFTVPVRDFTEESSVLAITEGETTLKVFEKIDLVTDKKDTLDVDSSLLELGLTTASMVSKEEEKELDKKLTSTDISFTLTEKENETPLIDLDFSTKIFKEETHSTIGNLEFTTALPSVEGEEKGVVVSTGSSFTSIDKETESPLTVLDLSISTIFNVEETKNTMINVESTTSSSLVEKEESKELQEPLTSKGPSFTLVIKEIETPLTELELSTNTVFKVEETTNAVVNIEFTTSSLSGGEKGKELEEKIISTDSSLTLADKESESPLIELDLSAKTTFNLEEIKNIMVNVEFTTPLPSVEDEEKGIVISTGSSFTLIDKETESSLTVLELNTSTIFEAQETEKTMKNVEFTTPSLSVEEEGKELQETTASTGPSFTLVIKEIETPLANLDSTTNTVVNIESTISLSSVEEEQAKELEEKIISTSSSLTLVEETNETPLTELDLSARTTFNLEEIRNLMVNVEFTSPLSLEQEGNVTSTGSSFTLVDKESDTSLTELNLSAKTTFNLEETKNTMENIKSTTPLLLVEKEETWDELESTTSVTTEESFTSREQEETSIITTESIKDKSEQKKKMEHLEERLKELEMLEKKMFQREQTHDEDVERWRQSKKERKQQLKDEILAKKQSTTIPTTEIDTITVSTPEDDLDTEIKRLEEEIGEKERELEERERRLHEREENFQKEREEFESELLKKESEQEKEKETTETKTMEGETTKTEIKEIKTFHESTPIPVTTTVKPSVSMSTQLPPVEETVSTTKWETTVVTTVLSVDHDDDDYIEGGTTENERKGQVAPKNQQGDKRGEYEYDQEEEIWKKQHPDHESINEDEPVTVKVCLNVLKNHSKILNGTVSSKKVCLPIISSDINEDIRHSDSVSRRLSRDVLPFFKNPSVTEITKLKRDDKNVKRIDSLDLQHEEWLENNATKPLQVFQGFTRVYEKWTEIPLEKYTIFHSITESDNLPQNKSFKVNQWRVDQNEKRIHPTKVDRLENFEWIEMTTNAMGVPHQNSHKLDEIGVEKRPRKRNLNYSRGKINDNYGHNKKSVADVAVDEFPPDYSENCNHDSNKKLNITLQPPLESETEDYRDIVRVETLDNEENDEVDDDKDCKNRKDKNELNEIDDDKIDNEKFEEKEENADADANDDDDDYDYEERDTKQIESELTDAKTEETFKDKGKSAENVKLSKANVSEGKIEEKIGLGTKENEDHEEIEYISDGTVDYKDNYNENYDDENVDTDYIDYKSDEMKPESKSMVQRPSMIKNHRSSSLEKNLERDKELMLLKREMDKINERKRKVLEEEKMLVKEEGFLNERKKLEQNDMDKKRNDRMIENTYRKSRSLLESNTENEGKGWPTENTLHYQIGGIETWVTSPPKKNDIVGKMRKSFTVNVLQLEYDEDEENHKLKSSNPDSEELIVKESTLRFNNCDRNKENPKLLNDKNENLLDVVEDGNSEEEELFEGITENNEVENNDWYDEVSQSEGAEDSPGNGRTPSGSEWPTERELKYHVGGTKHWQAEISGTPPVDYKDYYDKAYQDDHISGTTCVHVLIDKQSDLDKSKHEKEFLQDDFQAPLNLILPDNYEQLNDLNAPTEQLLDKFRKRRDSSSHLNDKYKNTLENPLMNLADSSFGESLTKIREAEENRPLGELSESYNIGRSLLALKTSRSKSKMLDKSQLNSIKQEKKKKLALKSNVREKKRSENSKFKDKNSFHDGQTDTLLAKVIKMINVEYPDGQSVTNEQETPLKDKHYKKEEFNHNKPRSLLQKVKSIINRAMDKSKQDETLVNSNKLDAPIDLLDSGPSESANKKNKAIAKVKHLENSKLSDKLEYRKSDSKVAQKTSENFKDHIDKDTKLKDRSKLVNIDTIIPAVKESLKHRNLGNVEKIIIYVDKSEEKNAVPWKQGIPESEDTFNIDKKLSRHKSYLSPDINGGKLIDRSTLSEELKLKGHSKEMPQYVDPHILVKVVQPVAHGAGIPHEETKTEFKLDLSKINTNQLSSLCNEKNHYCQPSLSNKMRTHDSKIGATNKSHDRKRQRLTNRDNERRMNLPEAPLKKRSNWSRKIAAINDKQQCVERKPNITILRHESLKELKRSLQDIEKTQSKNDKVKRTVLNNYDDSKGNNVENKIKGIDERIRIMYNMRHKKVDKADKALKSRMKNKKKHLIKDKRKKINAVDYSNTDNDQVDVEEKLEDKDVDGTAYENLYDEINDESEDSNEDVKTDETLKSNWKRSENNEARIKDDDKTQESMKNPGQKQSAKDIEIMAEKILRFADEIAAEKEKLNAIRSDYSDTDFNGVVDKFGNNELGLLDEEDKRSLKALIKEIMNVQKNVNKTLNIIEGKLKKDEHSSSPTSQKHLDNSGNSKKNNMRLIKKNEEGSEAWVADQLKNILSKMINKPKNNVKNITVAKNEMKRALDLLVNIPDYASLVDNGLTKSKRNDKSKKVKDKIKERRTGESAVKKSAGKGSAQKNVNKASKKVAKKKKVVKPKKTPVAIDEKKVEKVEKDIKKILKEESSLVQSDRKKKSSDFIECIDDEDLNPSETKISESYEKLLKTGQYNSGRKLLEFSGEWENDDNSWIDENYPEDPIKLFYESSIDSTENYSFANIEANKTDDNILSNKHKAISHENSLNKISLGRRILSMKKSQKKNQQAKSTKKSKEVLGKGTTSSKDKNMKKRSKGKSREGKLRKLKDSQELEKKIRPTKLASESSSMEEGNEQQKEKGKCSSCICDIGAMLDNLKDLLGKMSDPVNDIGMFDCDTYEDIGSQIILSQSMMKDTDSQRPRNFEKPRDQKYVRPEKVESVLAQEIQSQNEFEIVSLPGYDINIPCSKDNADVAWMSSYNKPNYIWKRLDGSPLSGFVRKNGDLELYDVDAKDSGNYSCEISYIDRENEKPVENIYETSVQIVTLPIYTLRGGCRYRIQSCDDIDMEGLSIGFPQKLKGIICKKNICDTHVLPPYCYREQILINTLVFPSPINKLIPVGSIHCGLHCRKALQDKIALLLRQNLKDILGRPIIFRLPHREEKLVPSEDKSLKLRRKRGRIIEGSNNDKYSEVGLFLGCPAGYGLQSTHCVPCTSGSYSDDNASFCKSCPLGTYQPNRGAKACHACTNPFLKDCYNMLWNSSSMLLVIIGSLSAIISLISILIWLCCCGKKKRKFHESSIAPCKYEDEIEMQPFIKDVSDNDDEICEYDYKPKKKRKVKLKKKIGKDERKRTCETDVFKSKLRKQQSSKPEWKNYVHQSTLTGVDSYRSHKDYINSSPKRYYYRRPPLPSPDFDR